MSRFTNIEADLYEPIKDLLGSDRIDTTDEGITAHCYDWWPVAAKWRQNGKAPCKPDIIVYPQNTQDVTKILSWANEHKVPVTAWGLGSSVVGQPLAEFGGVSLDLSRLDKIIKVDEENLIVRAQAGVMGGDLEDHLNKLGYTLNHSPQSLYRSTVGGWLSTRATGQLSSQYGGIEDLAYSFKAVLADGSIFETADLPRMAVGPDLRHVLIGAEGTLGVITEVALKIFPIAQSKVYDTLKFETVAHGKDAMRAIMANGLRPALLRFYDTAEAKHAMQDKAFSSPVMFLGTEGLEEVSQAEMNACKAICSEFGGVSIGPEGTQGWLKRRYDFSTIEGYVLRPEGVAETIEISNNWERIMDTYDVLTQRLAPLADEVLGHFSHVYTTGVSLYVILLGQANDGLEAQKRIETIWEIAIQAALETGASISHHHGSGLARNPYVEQALGSGLPVLQRVKDAMDPNNILNPGKLGLKRP